MNERQRILSSAQRILLVDWPNTDVPRALLHAGFVVFGFSPAGYSEAALAIEVPEPDGSLKVFPPDSEPDRRCLTFRRLPASPESVDIVNVYRPAPELPGIIRQHVSKLGAKVLWLEPPIESDEAEDIAEELGLTMIAGESIAAVARQLAPAE